MKKKLLVAVAMWIALSSLGQGFQAKIIPRKKMSRFFEYWYSDTAAMRIKLTNNSAVRRMVQFKVGLSHVEDNTGWNWANAAPTDTMWLPGGDTIVYFKDIMEFENIMFSTNGYAEYQRYGGLQYGNYKLFLEILNPAYDSIYVQDSANIEVKKELLPVAMQPYQFSLIPYNLRNAIRFTWGGNKHTYNQSHFYVLHMWKRPGLVDTKTLLPYTNEIFRDTFNATDTFTVLNGTSLMSDSNSVYYWAIRLLDATMHGYGDNDGLGTPIPIFVGKPVGLGGIGYIPINNPTGPPLQSSCGIPIMFDGFETNTWKGWGGKWQNTPVPAKGINIDNNDGFLTGGAGGNRHVINAKIYDNAFRDFTVYPGGGSYAAQCGDFSSSMAQSIYTTFPLYGAWKSNFNFWWSAVVNASKHDPEKSARIIYRLYRNDWKIDAQKTELVRELIINSETARFNTFKSLQQQNNGHDVYAWVQECWDLKDLPDGNYTFELITSSCTENNHNCKAWLDFCVNPQAAVNMNFNTTQACRINQQVGANGFSTIQCNPSVTFNPDNKVTKYWYEIYQSNAQGSKVKYLGLYNNINAPDWKNGATPVSIISFVLNTFLAARNTPVDKDSFFLITLHVETGKCAPLIYSQLVKFMAIEPNLAGPDRCCHNWNCSVQLGTSPKAGYTYQWGPASLTACLSNPTISNPIFHPTSNCNPGNSPYVRFVLYTQSGEGCADSSVVFVFKDSVKINSITIDTQLCYLKIHVNTNYPGNSLNFAFQLVDSSLGNAFNPNWGAEPGTAIIHPHYFLLQGGKLRKLRLTANIVGLCSDTSVNIWLQPYLGRKHGKIDTLLVNTQNVGDTFRILYQNRPNPNSRYNAFEWRMDVANSKKDFTEGVRGEQNIYGFPNGSVKISKSAVSYFNNGITPIKALFNNCNHDINFQSLTIVSKTTCEACYGRHDVVLKRTYTAHTGSAPGTGVVINKHVACDQDANVDADEVVDNGTVDKSTAEGHNEFTRVCVCKPYTLNKRGKRNYYTHGVKMVLVHTGYENHPHGQAYNVKW